MSELTAPSPWRLARQPCDVWGELFPVQYGDTHSVLFTGKALTNMLAVYLYKPVQNGIQRSRQCTYMQMCSTASWITQLQVYHTYVDMQSLKPGYSALEVFAMLQRLCPSTLGQGSRSSWLSSYNHLDTKFPPSAAAQQKATHAMPLAARAYVC